MKKIIKKNLKKPRKLKQASLFGVFTFGNINPVQGRRLLLIIAIVFAATLAVISSLTAYQEVNKPIVQASLPLVKKQSLIEKRATKLVEGYPIAEMMPYIFSKDPKVAVFMVAIAKKESAWGQHHPVLGGKDCYNYWGFRLKADTMGSGGHTCFDSPQQAVDVVASRIDELVNQENIDSPSAMIVWKCGYGCQDKLKTVAEKKWISDVDLYYSKFQEYL